MLNGNGDNIKMLLKAGTFLLGVLLMIVAVGMFMYQSFFNPGAAALTSAQESGLLIVGAIGALGIAVAIMMEYGNS